MVNHEFYNGMECDSTNYNQGPEQSIFGRPNLAWNGTHTDSMCVALPHGEQNVQMNKYLILSHSFLVVDLVPFSGCIRSITCYSLNLSVLSTTMLFTVPVDKLYLQVTTSWSQKSCIWRTIKWLIACQQTYIFTNIAWNTEWKLFMNSQLVQCKQIESKPIP